MHSYISHSRTSWGGTGRGWDDEKLRATDPRALHKYLDHPLGTGPLSMRASRVTLGRGSKGPGSSYEPSISWDGQSTNPAPFSRLEQTGVVRPEGHQAGGLFGRATATAGPIPYTVEQETTRALEPEGPHREAQGEGKSLVVERPFFDSAKVVHPGVEARAAPEIMASAGPHCDEILLTPQERRKINEHEVLTQRAAKLQRKALHQKERLQYILKHRHPQGAIQVESSSNTESQVFGATAASDMLKEDRVRSQQRARTTRLSDLTRSGGWLSNDTEAGVNASFMQTKGRVNRGSVDTHKNLFAREEPRPRDYRREQELFNQLSGGKGFNIVSGTRAWYMRIVHLRYSFPSSADRTNYARLLLALLFFLVVLA
ncbi:unnamed protein product [Chrysoparadoxa australica]